MSLGYWHGPGMQSVEAFFDMNVGGRDPYADTSPRDMIDLAKGARRIPSDVSAARANGARVPFRKDRSGRHYWLMPDGRTIYND